MAKVLKQTAAAFLAALLLAACEMGLGTPIDLEPPVLWVERIILPNGEIIEVEEEDNKLFIGPGLLVGAGFTLEGRARDNVQVEQIVVEEVGANAEKIDGKNPRWDQAIIASASRMGDEQKWSIELTGINKGERTISITAYDRPRNIGPDSVKQLTLLVDTDPPFVEDVKIERQAGIQIELLPRSTLEALDPDQFEHIDYFQNEYFTVRAAIDHDFSLSSVTLNFIEESGNPLFQTGLRPTDGSLYAPSWYVTAEQLIAANPLYQSGRRYLNVAITAEAEAGHSGQNEDVTNLLYNLCWYPEADIPRIKAGLQDDWGVYVQKGDTILLDVFDDDNLAGVYAGLFSAQYWDEMNVGMSDSEKLTWLTGVGHKDNVTDEEGNHPLRDNRLKAVTRSEVVSVESNKTHGEYRLVVLAHDQKASGGVWGHRIVNVMVLEDGVPILSVDGFSELSPTLHEGSFTVTGSVMNLYAVNQVRIAWVPEGLGLDSDRQRDEGLAALRAATATSVLANGIKVWALDLNAGLGAAMPSTIVPGYITHEFTQSFNIFTDFMFRDVLENAPKLFLFYVDGMDRAERLRVGAYTEPPNVIIESPANGDEYGPDSDIHFEIEISSPLGVPIVSVELHPDNDAPNEPLTFNAVSGVWETVIKLVDKRDYTYEVSATDQLGNIARQEVHFTVTTLPNLQEITSSHNSGTTFSSGEGNNTITIQARFDRQVATVTTLHGTPSITLSGFTDTKPRSAYYVSGVNSTILNFEYVVQIGDSTGATPLSATALEMNDAYISAETWNISALSADKKLPATKYLYIDGTAPEITNVTFAVTEADEDYYKPTEGKLWIREGASVEITVTTSKPVWVLGAPRLPLTFDTGTVYAEFRNNKGSTLTFVYDVPANRYANPITCVVSAAALAGEFNGLIQDQVGSRGNDLQLPASAHSYTSASVALVDSRTPSTLTVTNIDPQGSELERFQIQGTVKSGASVQYTLNAQQSWNDVASPYQFPVSEKADYEIYARQIDLAGNVSDLGSPLYRNLLVNTSLSSVICENPDSTYPYNSSLTFKLLFTGQPISTGGGNTGPTITLAGGSNAGNNSPITLTTSAAAAVNTLEFRWAAIDEGRIMRPVEIVGINLQGITVNVDGGGTEPFDVDAAATSAAAARNTFHNDRGGLNVYSVRPSINTVNGAATANMGSLVLAATGANSILQLGFNNAVFPNSGSITVRPAGEWYIPPVVSNSDYTDVTNALSSGAQNTLNAFYQKTTHGLTAAAGVYVPDTDTKYVLDFDVGISGNATVDSLRAIFDEAKYRWQEIQVATLGGSGTNTITVNLDKLADGRQWKLVIPEGAFRDEYGNTSAAWQWDTGTSAYTFWSANTATPVIRVNRVSNNRANDRVAVVANPEAILRTNVQYRIDCETPGATIYSTTYQGGIGEITDAMTNENTYAPSNTDGAQNSQIADVSATTLAGLTITGAYPAGEIRTIGDESLYTARKDYIAARATRTLLADSSPGYEGAFKTVIVYRNITIADQAGRWVKYEGTNEYGGATTLPGFPLSNNNMTGSTSKYAYQNGNDWIWITWEVVCNFWHVALATYSDVPNTTLDGDSWMFESDWSIHSFRKYGNWGLRVGNHQN